MEIGLIILAVMLASLIGWLLKQTLNAEPWVAEAVDTIDESRYQAPFNAKPKLVALTLFLAVVTSFFALIFSAYALRMELGDWVPLTEPQLLWTNTVVLILASIAFQWTRNGASTGDIGRLRPGLAVTGLLTAAFLFGQFIAWQQLQSSGHYMTSNPSIAFFFMLTGLHALHILGGMYVWARATLRVFGGDSDVEQSITLCTIYWHFLLLVWLVMFGLMLST
ncbi:MAG: cytochrome c oxidase subunit 3 [Proteobacteria bacterium]|nr:cytochrome c oxidase subunit 3 [Pseudomonadota bacterium]